MSTITRYLFRLGARVMINCHYYGGISTFQKYRAIRCMRDDRCGDGALMQIDQCLCCTRFEPIFGQVYECMNDIGVNVAQVLDDLQASYMNNEEYIRMSRIEEYITSPKQGKIDLTKVLKDQGTDSRGFDDIWGNGIKVNWTLVPVEEQKPHINWRQSIDDDGSRLGRLASWQDINSGHSASITNPLTNEDKTNVYLRNQQAMDSHKGNGEYSSYIEEGRSLAESAIDQARTDYENNSASIKDAIGNGNDLDNLAVLAAAIARGTTDYQSIVNEYRQVSTNIGCSNPALVWTAMDTSSTIVKMYVDGTLQSYVGTTNQNDKDNTSNRDGKSNASKSSGSARPNVELIPAPNIVEHSWGNQRESIGEVTNITIHHAGGEMTVEQVHELHTSGSTGITSGIGYHYFIESDGTIHRGNPDNMIGAHVGGANTGNIGISLSGNLSQRDPTEAQWSSLVSLVAYVCKQFSLTPSRSVIRGHREWPGHESNECPGNNMYAKLDNLVSAVSSGKASGMSANNSSTVLWVDCAELLKKGIEKDGKSSANGLSFFPKICYLYVKLMNDIKNSSFDGDSGWGFPYTEDIINSTPEKCVFLVGYCGETSGHAGKHEGCDIQPSGVAENPGLNIPFCAVKDGTVRVDGDPGWCNSIYIEHDDGTWSRYLHCRSVNVSKGQRVSKGQQIGITGGSDGSSESYPVHLHIEFGHIVTGKTPYEKVYNDNCLIVPEDQWRKPNGTDPVSGKPMWSL